MTDHLSNFVLIDTEIIKEKKRPLVRLFTQRNIDKVQATLNCHPPLINENPNGTLLNDSVNENFSNLTDNCIKSLNDRFPLVKLSRSKARDKPYITSALKVSIRYKNHLHNQYLNNKTPVNKSKWQNYRRKLSVALKIAEKMFVRDKIDYHSNSSLNMWKFIGNILKNNSNKVSSITELKIRNTNITNQNSITKGLLT